MKWATFILAYTGRKQQRNTLIQGIGEHYLVNILNVMNKQSKRKRNGKERRAKNYMIEEVIKSEVKTGKKII